MIKNINVYLNITLMSIMLVGYIILLSTMLTGCNSAREELKQSCNIPQDYCDPSIESLEQGLKKAFEINDMNSDSLNRCMGLVKKYQGQMSRCYHNFDICNEELEGYVLK